jgi:hypothetical protein
VEWTLLSAAFDFDFDFDLMHHSNKFKSTSKAADKACPELAEVSAPQASIS